MNILIIFYFQKHLVLSNTLIKIKCHNDLLIELINIFHSAINNKYLKAIP